MQLSVKQYNTLIKAINFAFTKKDCFCGEDIKPLYDANDTLWEVYEKHLKDNRRTADYIAKKRITDKNYARSKKNQETKEE